MRVKRERAPRYRRDATIEMRGARSTRLEGHLINISSTGALIRLWKDIPQGSLINLVFRDNAPGVQLRAKVVRIASAAAAVHTQMAVKFLPRTKLDHSAIRCAITNQQLTSIFPRFWFSPSAADNFMIIFTLLVKITLYLILPVFVILSLVF